MKAFLVFGFFLSFFLAVNSQATNCTLNIGDLYEKVDLSQSLGGANLTIPVTGWISFGARSTSGLGALTAAINVGLEYTDPTTYYSTFVYNVPKSKTANATLILQYAGGACEGNGEVLNIVWQGIGCNSFQLSYANTTTSRCSNLPGLYIRSDSCSYKCSFQPGVRYLTPSSFRRPSRTFVSSPSFYHNDAITRGLIEYDPINGFFWRTMESVGARTVKLRDVAEYLFNTNEYHNADNFPTYCSAAGTYYLDFDNCTQGPYFQLKGIDPCTTRGNEFSNLLLDIQYINCTKFTYVNPEVIPVAAASPLSFTLAVTVVSVLSSLLIALF